MSSSAKTLLTGLDTHELPRDTRELRAGLKKFLLEKLTEGITVGGCKFGVYAFFDFDGEPIYVGQTRESLGTRIRRHLTNQRTDAVAMSVLDPFEVHTVEVWPLAEYQNRNKKDSDVRAHLDALEATVFVEIVRESKFNAVLNEKEPASNVRVDLPKSVKASIVMAEVNELRGHPDIRLARRAETIARLARVICEREVQPGLRRTLLVQAQRLSWLAEERLKPFKGAVEAEDEKGESEEDREKDA